MVRNKVGVFPSSFYPIDMNDNNKYVFKPLCIQ